MIELAHPQQRKKRAADPGLLSAVDAPQRRRAASESVHLPRTRSPKKKNTPRTRSKKKRAPRLAGPRPVGSLSLSLFLSLYVSIYLSISVCLSLSLSSVLNAAGAILDKASDGVANVDGVQQDPPMAP